MLLIAGADRSYEDLRAINKERGIWVDEAADLKLSKAKTIGSIDNRTNPDALGFEINPNDPVISYNDDSTS